MKLAAQLSFLTFSIYLVTPVILMENVPVDECLTHVFILIVHNTVLSYLHSYNVVAIGSHFPCNNFINIIFKCCFTYEENAIKMVYLRCKLIDYELMVSDRP